MKPVHAWLAMAGLIALCVAPAAHAQADRADAEVRCEPTGEHLAFDCAVRLTNRRTGAPVEGARITVHADMPSMPMSHRLSPVQTEPSGEPGTYRLRIVLEMPGVWALRLDVSGPLRDVVVARLDFRSAAGDRPATADEPHGHGGHERADSGPAQGQEPRDQ